MPPPAMGGMDAMPMMEGNAARPYGNGRCSNDADHMGNMPPHAMAMDAMGSHAP